MVSSKYFYIIIIWPISSCSQKNEKKNDDSDTNNKIIRLGYRNGICHRKICHGHNEKWNTTNNGRNRRAKLRKNQNAQRKGKLQVLGNIGSGHLSNKRR